MHGEIQSSGRRRELVRIRLRTRDAQAGEERSTEPFQRVVVLVQLAVTGPGYDRCRATEERSRGNATVMRT